MEPRILTAAERETQILALWRDRPHERRAPEHIVGFYDWLIAYAPWLVPSGSVSLDSVRSLLEAHTVNPEQLLDAAARKPRGRTGSRRSADPIRRQSGE
jgi:hypothetical protein